METFRPTLLLSMPQLQDPNFARTVVLLCDFATAWLDPRARAKG